MNPSRTPSVRFKGYEDEWEERKLGELASFSKGNGYTKNDLVEFGDPIILYGRLYTKYETVIEKVDTFVNKKDNSIISEGSEVIVPASGESSEDISRASVVGKSGLILGGDLNIIKPVNYIDSIFLALTISNGSQQQEMSKRAQGKSVVHLHNSDLKQVNLLYPKLEEQQKIGSFFKKLDNTISLHQRKLNLLNEQKKGFLQKMFPKNGEIIPEIRFAGFNDDWEERKLGEITTSYSGGTPSAGNSSYYKGDIPFIRSGEINSSKTELFLTEEGFNNSSAKLVEVGDILYALYGATSGEVGISQINGAINQAILAIKPIEGYESQFIMQWLKLQKQKIIDKYLQGGQGNLSGTIVKDLFLRIPDSKEQKKIGQFFKQLDDTIALHQRKIDELKLMKKSMLQKMFV
jgi:type I restriction enzyme S subunit